LIRSSILVREPCGRRVGREKKDATSTSRGKTTGVLVWEEATWRPRVARACGASAAKHARFVVTRQIARVRGKTRDAIAVCGAWRRVARRTLRAFVSLAEE
jgi:hypothetical protein